MSKLLSDPLLVSLATGVNTIAMAIVQYFFKEESSRQLLTTCTPIVVNFGILLVYWLWLWSGWKAPSIMKAEKVLDEKIVCLEDNIAKLKSMGMCTKQEEKDYKATLAARANLSAVPSKR